MQPSKMTDKRILDKSPTITRPLPIIDFPTASSSLTNQGKEIIHFSHPQHPLACIHFQEVFTCAGCKEYGSGKRYTCRLCDHQLHDFCALAPQDLKEHPFHYQHRLIFYSKPGATAKSKCDACGKSVKGYTFRCNACSFQMHPCCAMLPDKIIFSPHPHVLRLLPAIAIPSGEKGFACGQCKKKKPGRVYRCTECKYYLHAVCAKAVFNGLFDSGIGEVDKPSMLGTAGRVAAQVVKGFVGGVMEGIGEGLGQDIIQNLVLGSAMKSVTPNGDIGHHGIN